MGLRLTANTDGNGLAWTLQPSYGAGNGDLALAAGPSLWTDEQFGSTDRLQSFSEWGDGPQQHGIHLQSGELLLTPFTQVRL